MWSRGLFPWGTRELVISRAQESPGSGSRRSCLQESPRLDGAFPRGIQLQVVVSACGGHYRPSPKDMFGEGERGGGDRERE